jgi:predicted nicotinamide N-methyase
MTASSLDFNATINRWDLSKLRRPANATKLESDYSIELTENKHVLKSTVKVHVVITGDINRAHAFKKWVQEFALRTS